jgi:hypothetical protein
MVAQQMEKQQVYGEVAPGDAGESVQSGPEDREAWLAEITLSAERLFGPKPKATVDDDDFKAVY